MATDWIDELRVSLLDAADHVAPGHFPFTIDSANGPVVVMRLQISMSKEAKRAAETYIRTFARESGWRVKVTIKPRAIELSGLEPYVPPASQRSGARTTPSQ